MANQIPYNEFTENYDEYGLPYDYYVYNLEEDMVNHLNGNITLTKDTNLFRGQVKDIKNIIQDHSVFVRGISGTAADRVFQLTYEISKPQVQIYVRSNVNDEKTARRLMYAIYTFLKSNIPTGYLDCRCLQSEPQNLGEDDKGRYLFTMTFECWREDTR